MENLTGCSCLGFHFLKSLCMWPLAKLDFYLDYIEFLPGLFCVGFSTTCPLLRKKCEKYMGTQLNIRITQQWAVQTEDKLKN